MARIIEKGCSLQEEYIPIDPIECYMHGIYTCDGCDFYVDVDVDRCDGSCTECPEKDEENCVFAWSSRRAEERNTAL